MTYSSIVCCFYAFSGIESNRSSVYWTSPSTHSTMLCQMVRLKWNEKHAPKQFLISSIVYGYQSKEMAFNIIVQHFMVNPETGKDKVNHLNLMATNQWRKLMLLILRENDVIYLIESLYAENQPLSFATQGHILIN